PLEVRPPGVRPLEGKPWGSGPPGVGPPGGQGPLSKPRSRAPGVRAPWSQGPRGSEPLRQAPEVGPPGGQGPWRAGPPEGRLNFYHPSAPPPSPGLVEGSEVTQTPTILWGLKDSDAQMNCSHTKGSDYKQMYWYRQRPGEGMKQVVYTSSYSKPDYGAFGEDKYPTVKTAAESGSFTVKKVEAGDSGMYFCAVYEHRESFSSMVNQSPVALIEGPGRNVQLTCRHTIPNYLIILWYQQSAGDTAMKLIGYLNVQSITLESPLEKHFNVSGDGRKEAHLHLLSLRGPEDSAVYYCAASQHSDVEHLLSST
ncbi:unnamed protein product, partial [Coregonus sp. 'balchen']